MERGQGAPESPRQRRGRLRRRAALITFFEKSEIISLMARIVHGEARGVTPRTPSKENVMSFFFVQQQRQGQRAVAVRGGVGFVGGRGCAGRGAGRTGGEGG